MRSIVFSFAMYACLCAAAQAQTSPVENLSGNETIWGQTSDGKLVLNNSADSSFSGIIQDVSGTLKTNVEKTGNYRLTLSGANTYTGTTTVSAGTMELVLVSSITSTLNATIQSGAVLEIDHGTATGNATISGTLAGSGKLLFNTETGREPIYNLDGSAFTGDIEIAKGIAQFGSVKLGTGKIILSGGTLKNKDSSRTITNNITLADGTSSSLRCGWGSGSVLTLDGVISGSGNLEIANDQWTVKLNKTNTYTGSTKIGGGINGWSGGGQGTLVLGAENALGAGAVTFGTNKSSVDFAGFSQSIGGLDNGSLTEIAVKNSSATSTPSLTLTVADGKSYSYSGTMPTLATLTKAGAGTQTFTNQQSASTIAVSGGKLQLNMDANSTAAYNLTGGTLEVSNIGNNNVTLGGTLTGSGKLLFNTTNGREPIYNLDGSSFTGVIEITKGIVQFNSVKLGTGSIILSGGTLKNQGGTRTISNNITLATGTASSLRGGYGNTSFLNINGVISGDGNLEIANEQASVKLMKTNTYTGTTKIGGGINSWSGGGQGTLVLAAENALGTGAVTFGSIRSSVDLGGFNQTIGGLYDTVGLTDTGTIKNTGAAATLTLSVADGEDYSWSGTISNSDKISLVKKGLGVQTFNSKQAVASTKVETGVLKLTSGFNTGNVIINSGAAITFMPTAAEEYARIASADFSNGSTMDLIIESPTEFTRFAFDTVPIFDETTGFLKIINEATDLSTGASFKVSNSLPGITADKDLESWLASAFRNEWNLTWDNANSAMTLQRDSAAVPEPSTWLLLLVGVGILAVRRRKNRA